MITHRAATPQLPEIPVATHSFRQRYLYAFATQAEVLHHVRTQALEVDAQRLPEILGMWEALQPRIDALVEQECGLPETIRVGAVSEQYRPKLENFASDPLFQKTFSQMPVNFAVIEIDKLIAPQRAVNLDFVDRLLASYPSSPTAEELLNICVSPKRTMDPIQHLEIGANTHVFSSPNSDIRFLGAFVKPLKADDLRYAVSGGVPAAAIITFVGYGGAPVNVFRAGSRLILNNGFHRVYALRTRGVTEIPVVLQEVRNPQLEFPPNVAGIPKEYLLGHPRPVLMRDFFESDFAITLQVRERMKIVTVGVAVGQHDVPA